MKLNDATLLKERCYVGGEWIGEPSDPVNNPATGETIARVPRFGAVESTDAIQKAEQAFPAWSRKTAKERSVLIRRWFDLTIANKEDIALLMTSEQGKPLAESRGEVEYAAAFIEYYAEEAKRIYGETIPSHRADARIMVIRQPVGVVAAITPWNFPAAMITRKVGPALAVGCTAVVKPARETPLTALALAALAEHPAVRLVTFTGSTETGKVLMRQAASTVKKLGLELGGNAPFIVFDDADLDAAVEGAMVSKFRNMGQTCVCANRVYAQEGVYDEFVARLAKKVMDLKVGNGVEVGVTQGPLINADAVEKVEHHIADAVGQGARVVVGGHRHSLGHSFFEPTVLANVTTKMLVTREETFGPVAPVYRFTDEADVIAQANATQYGLAAYFYARDLGRVFRVAEALEYGMVGVNTGLISTEVAPFGGVKESGIGREGSRHGTEEYTELKYMLLAGLER